MTNSTRDTKWTAIIEPRQSVFDIRLADMWNSKYLAWLFIRRDFVAPYKQTILGPLWFILNPLASTLIITIVFGRIAKIPTDGIPDFLFYLCGTLCWGYFSACVIGTSDTFMVNAAVFSKVYFPRLIVPVTVVVSSLGKLAIQLVLFAIFWIYFWAKGTPIVPTVLILVFPLLVLQMALLGLGFGILVSALTTKYRDLNVLVGFGMTLWMYASPVVYPLSEVPERYQFIQVLNPMVSVLEGFRLAFLGKGTFTLSCFLASWCLTIGVLMLGVIAFNRMEKTFLDTV